MLRNLKDAWSWIERVILRLERLESGAMLGNSSITKGRMRFIGGLLRVDSGGRVEIVGTWRFVGNGAITGDVVAEGKWTQNGSWEFNGPGDISGDVAISGDLDLTGDLEVLGEGRIRVGNVILSPEGNGRITVGTGTRQIVIDATTPRITIGGGTAQILIDPNQLKVGPAFKMDPAHSTTGAQQEFGPNGRATIYGGDDLISILLKSSGGSVLAGVNLQPNIGPIGTGPGVEIQGLARLATMNQLPSGHGYQRLVRSTEDGVVYWHAGGIGGPGDGIFEWPFPLDQVTSEFRSPERPGHDGIDFGIGPSNTEGTPIPSAGSGVVETVGSPSGSHGWGHYVLVNHGTDPLYGNAVIQTRYAHMYQAPPVSVGDPVDLGMTLGGIGNTGNSFGNHLHFEVLANGVYVNPRTFMSAHGG